MTRNGVPSSSPKSQIATMFGWNRRPAARAFPAEAL